MDCPPWWPRHPRLSAVTWAPARSCLCVDIHKFICKLYRILQTGCASEVNDADKSAYPIYSTLERRRKITKISATKFVGVDLWCGRMNEYCTDGAGCILWDGWASKGVGRLVCFSRRPDCPRGGGAPPSNSLARAPQERARAEKRHFSHFIHTLVKELFRIWFKIWE